MPFLDAKALESDPSGMSKLKDAISARTVVEPQVVIIPAAKPRQRAVSALGRLGLAGASALRLPLRRAVGAL